MIRKLRVNHGDILLVKKDTDMETAAKLLGDALAQRGFDNVLVIAVADLDDISKIDREVMHEYGWFQPRDYALMMERMSPIEKAARSEESE
jgi:hypothetical protein